MRTSASAALLLCTAQALAQEADIQKQIIQRQQQSDAFSLQLRQSQERLLVPTGDTRRLRELDDRQTGERQRFDAISERQLREVRPDTPQELRPQERQRAADERRPFVSPIVEVPVTPAPAPPPLQPSLEGNVDVIDAPR